MDTKRMSDDDDATRVVDTRESDGSTQASESPESSATSAIVADTALEVATEKSSRTSDLPPPRLIPATDRVTLVRRGSRYVVSKPTRLRNSLLGAVGLLELANAGDFAANVWNMVPVPVYAVVFMAIGGTAAFVLSFFAFRDAQLSWANVQTLREDRRQLRQTKAERLKESQPVLDIDVLLDVNFRELGTEAIGRYGMDLLLGSGAILIAAGTWMAIDGANYRVWQASNLLSGYIGNTPLAVYGCVNAAWAVYIWRKAHLHKAAGEGALKGSPALAVVRRRARNMQIFSIVSGLTSVIGAVGSLVSATMWWGYVILIPVIVSSILLNTFWRKRVGYDRPMLGDTLGMSQAMIIAELDSVTSAKKALKAQPEKLLPDLSSIASVVEFIVANDLFEVFCIYISRDKQLSGVLFRGTGEVTVEATSLLLIDEHHADILNVAGRCLRETGPKHFQYCEWYLAEILGSFLHVTGDSAPTSRPSGLPGPSGPPGQIHNDRESAVER